MRRALQVLALLGTLIVGAASLALIVSQTAWFKDWLRGFIVRQANDYLNGELVIGRLGGNLFFGVELEDVAVSMGGRPVIVIDDVGLDYNAFSLLGGAVALDDIRLNKPVVTLRRTEGGWNLGGLVKPRAQEAEREGPGRAVSIGEIGITDGTIVVEDPSAASSVSLPPRIEKLNATVGFAYQPVDFTVDIGHLSLRAPDRAFQLNDLSGRVATKDDAVFVDDLAVRTAESSLAIDGVVRNYLKTPELDVRVSSDKLALEEIARFVPALERVRLQPAFEVSATGPLDALKVAMNVRSSAGRVAGNLTADVLAPERAVAGRLELERVDIAAFVPNARPSDITGQAVLDLRLTGPTGENPLAGIDGRWQFVAPRVAVLGYEAREVDARGRIERGVLHVEGRAAAYGGRATVSGTIEPGPTLRLNLAGNASAIDLRNLPPQLDVPGAPSDLNVDYRLSGTPDALTANVLFHPSTLAGARIAEGGTATVRIGGALGYEADATVQNLDLQRFGTAFGIDALAGERYRSDINGTFSVRGRGTRLDSLSLDARGALTASQIFGGRVPDLNFEAQLARQALSVTARGGFADFDPGALAGRADLAGSMSGTVDLRARIASLETPLDPAGLDARGTISLGTSQVGELAITKGVIQGDYANRRGDLQAFSITGPDFAVDGKGRIDLQENGASDLTYQASMTDLEIVGRLTNQPLSGAATVDGRLTGNAARLETTGTATVSNFRYGDTAAVLAGKSQYQVQIPDLQPAQAQVTADTTATLIEVAGRQLTEVTARTTWGGQTLGFDVTLHDQQREVAAAGDVTLHPDHQEIHLRNLALGAEGIEWRTEQGVEAAIQYGQDRIAVQNLRLVSGAQRLQVDGVFGGEPGQTLIVQASDVDLARLDALALGQNRFGGTLDATATVTGSREQPQVDARFNVAAGSFRDFKYHTLDGTVRYDAAGVRLDTRLLQTPEAWITAKGFVPAAFLRGTPGGGQSEGVPHVESAPGEGLDVTVTSSALDLGIVQGFVPQLSQVSGTLQAEVRVTGAPGDPHLNGYVDIRNGSFIVADLTKGGYTGLDTRITLTPDRVRIEDFSVLDEHQNPLRISGELALHERQIGDVRIALESTDFEVIDNELADVKLNSDIRMSGTLQAPRVEGQLGIQAGTIYLDRVLEMATTNAYDQEPAPIEQSAAGPMAVTAGAETQDPAAPTDPDAVAGAAPPETVQAGAPAASAGDAAGEQPGVFEAMTLDVRLEVPNNLVVKGSDLNPSGASPIGLGDVNVTIGGNVRALKQPGADLRLTGTINTVRGTYDFQGRRFDIQRDGRIQFVGGSELNPRLDITATRVISGVEAFVHVRGTARRPQLALSSRPPLDEADILSLIVFNQPVNSLGEGQQISLAQRAGALATGFVASSLAQSIGGALELDVFEIETTPTSGGSPTVTLGEQVGERLYFKFRQAFGAQSVSQFILEYQLSDFLRLQTSVAEGGSASQRTLMQRVEQAGIDLIFYYTY